MPAGRGGRGPGRCVSPTERCRRDQEGPPPPDTQVRVGADAAARWMRSPERGRTAPVRHPDRRCIGLSRPANLLLASVGAEPLHQSVCVRRPVPSERVCAVPPPPSQSVCVRRPAPSERVWTLNLPCRTSVPRIRGHCEISPNCYQSRLMRASVRLNRVLALEAPGREPSFRAPGRR